MEKAHLPEVIEGSRIVLRKHRPDLAELMFSYVDRDRDRLADFLPWVEFTRTLEDEQSYISLALTKWDAHELYDYGLFEKASGYYMGNVGVHTIDWEHEHGELGYWILGDFEGKGFISEAVTRLEYSCFQIGFHRLEIRCSSRNLRSAKVPGRCGYTLEGCLREDAREGGKWRDTLVFAKLRGQGANSSGLVALDGLHLYCRNLPSSRAWYLKVLGLPPVIDTPESVVFRPGGGSRLSLTQAPADQVEPLRSVAFWRLTDLDSGLKHFLSHGAVLCGSPRYLPTGERICELRDPFGQVLGLIG